jgi:hypothetical protein
MEPREKAERSRMEPTELLELLEPSLG